MSHVRMKKNESLFATVIESVTLTSPGKTIAALKAALQWDAQPGERVRLDSRFGGRGLKPRHWDKEA